MARGIADRPAGRSGRASGRRELRSMRRARALVAVLAAGFLSWAAVADNPAVCPDEPTSQGQTQHGTPASSHCCLMAPCRTPTVAAAVATVSAPPASALAMTLSTPLLPESAEKPAPPTPPPTAFE